MNTSNMQEKIINESDNESVHSQEMDSEPLILELDEEEGGSDHEGGDGQTQVKKPMKWLPVKNKYMFYSIIAFLERLRSDGDMTE